MSLNPTRYLNPIFTPLWQKSCVRPCEYNIIILNKNDSDHQFVDAGPNLVLNIMQRIIMGNHQIKLKTIFLSF